METVIAQLTPETIHNLITGLGSIVFLILIAVIFTKCNSSFICLSPILLIIMYLFFAYREADLKTIKAEEYANSLKQEIFKSQDIIVVDKEKLCDITDKSYLNEVEISLIKENYKPVRENDQCVYFQKCSNKS